MAKLDKAIDRARNKSVADDVDDEAIVTISDEQMLAFGEVQGIEPLDPMKLVRGVKEEGFVPAERFLQLEEGQMFEGFLIDKGPTTITDKRTREPKQVMRYKFELASGARVSLIGTTMIDSAFSGVVADGTCLARVARGANREVNGNRMHDFIVLLKPGARPRQISG